MSDYSRESLRKMLEKESVGVCKYLNDNNLEPKEENIKAYYDSINKIVNKNGIKKMSQYLRNND